MISPLNVPVGPSAIQSIGDIVMGNSVLFLFSPRQIVDHYKRPLMYNFNMQMMDAITEHIVARPTMHSVRKVMNTTPDINQAIVPSAQDGIPVHTSHYSSNWMFVLIIDDDPKRNMMLSNKLVSRTILIGMCLNEPIGKHGLASATPEAFLNPNCQLVITRQIEMNKYTTMHAHGPVQKVKTVGDTNVVGFDESVWGNSPNIYDSYFALTPGEITAATNISDDEQATSLMSSSDSLNVKGIVKLSSELESPRQHMKALLTAFEAGATHMAHDEQIGEFGDGVGALMTGGESFETYVHASLGEDTALRQSVRNNSILDPGFLNVGMVMTKYHPKVHVINTPKTTNAEIIPQHYTNISVIFSSLVASVMPTYLNAVGLSAVSFMFNSYHQASQVMHIESVLTVSEQELQQKWNQLDFLLNNELYPVLMGNGGHFDLQVMSSVNSTTDIILNFLDFEPLPVGTVYEENSVLGGITSPLIGTGDHLVRNSMQINNLIKNVGSYVSHSHNPY